MSASRVAVSAMACAVLAAGCAVDQGREVATYRDVLDRGLNSSSSGAVPSDAASPLTLFEAMRLANASSERLAIAGEEYLQAIIRKRRAAAVFLPTVTLSPSYALRDPDDDADGSALDVSVDAGVDVNPVRDLAEVRAAGTDIDVLHALLLDAQDTLLIDVARAFYEVLRAERAVAVIENSLKVQEERVRDALGRQQAGVVRPLDVSLSESQAAATRVTLVEARTDVQNARTLLALLTASAVQGRMLDDSLSPPSLVDDVEACLSEAELNRQDVQAADAAVVSAGHRVESAYGPYFPSVSLNLAYFLSRESEPSDLDWTALIGVSLPLFSAGVIEADVREALSLLRQAKQVRSLTMRQARADVEIAHVNVLAAAQRVIDLEVSVRAAGDALDQSEGLYRVGLATNLERLAAQDQLLAAQLQFANADFDRKVFHLDLQRTTGRLHEVIGLHRDEPQPASGKDRR